MLQSFADEDAQRHFEGRRTRRLPADSPRRARRKLLMLDAATELESLRVQPGNRLEALRGDRGGQHSIRVNQQRRIGFRWHDGQAYDVEILDDH